MALQGPRNARLEEQAKGHNGQGGGAARRHLPDLIETCPLQANSQLPGSGENNQQQAHQVPQADDYPVARLEVAHHRQMGCAGQGPKYDSPIVQKQRAVQGVNKNDRNQQR